MPLTRVFGINPKQRIRPAIAPLDHCNNNASPAFNAIYVKANVIRKLLVPGVLESLKANLLKTMVVLTKYVQKVAWIVIFVGKFRNDLLG